jgi:hypothetical protein
LGGDSFKIRLDFAKSIVGEAKAEIARVQGTEVIRQELYRVAVREDGGAVREDDAEPELLDDESLALEEGAVVAMAVKELPLVWRTFPDKYVKLSEDGTVATAILDNDDDYSHVTTGVELTDGRHYWEVEILLENMTSMYVGVTRPNLDPVGWYISNGCNEGWFTYLVNGGLYTATANHSMIKQATTTRVTVWGCCWTSTTARCSSSRTAYSTAPATQQAA